MGEERKSSRKRRTTKLDRRVERYRETGKHKIFEVIYYDIINTVKVIAARFYKYFPDRTFDDLVQEAMLHVHFKVIPKYDIHRASFKTIASIAVEQKFIRMLKSIKTKRGTIINMPTFTEIEFHTDIDIQEEAEDTKNFMDDEVIVRDLLRLFKERLSKESWRLYRRIYRDPDIDFARLARKKGLSQSSLYRKCRDIYLFLTMLVEKGMCDDHRCR